MLRALFSGVSGLRSHQFRMDVIGNNLANVNTIAFKTSRVTFSEGFSEVLANASRSTEVHGGSNPNQVGSGITIGSVDQIFTQGAFENSGRPLDLAIQGDGFFLLREGGKNLYSRAGNFQIDAAGKLVLGNTGYILQGLNADSTGNIDGPIQDIILNLQDKAPAHATSELQLNGNLDAEAEIGDSHSLSFKVFDAMGRKYQLDIEYTKVNSTTWDWVAKSNDATVTSSPGQITFNTDGSFNSFSYPGGGSSLTVTPADGAAFDMEILVEGENGRGGLTTFAGASSAAVIRQDGYTAGDLTTIRIDRDGIIQGIYNNGTSLSLGHIAITTFRNPSGLIRVAGSAYEESANSGPALSGFAGSTSASAITNGALESSNVDISEEFTRMIVTQRGFQANARVITTADELLQELINLKR